MFEGRVSKPSAGGQKPANQRAGSIKSDCQQRKAELCSKSSEKGPSFPVQAARSNERWLTLHSSAPFAVPWQTCCPGAALRESPLPSERKVVAAAFVSQAAAPRATLCAHRGPPGHQLFQPGQHRHSLQDARRQLAAGANGGASMIHSLFRSDTRRFSSAPRLLDCSALAVT